MASSTVISEAYLIIVSLIAAAALGAGAYFGSTQIADAMRSTSQGILERAEVRVDILFAFAEQGSSTVKLWVKNTGKRVMLDGHIALSDLFFGPRGSFSRIPYNTGNPPYWTYVLVNDDGDGEWEPGETIEITITLPSAINAGDYYARYSAYTGASSDIFFTVG